LPRSTWRAANPAPAAERAVVGDDGAAIVLTSYLGRGAVAAVPLSTRNAVKLAGELITAVGSRLAAADRGDLG
jgi:hypothetical protein